MDEKDKIMAFDTLYTNNHIQMLKIIFTYLDHRTQRNLAVYIKLLELQYTMSFFGHISDGIPQSSPTSTIAFTQLCDEIFPYCSSVGQEKLQQIRRLYSSFENMQQMMQMFEMMRELMPDTFSGSEGTAMDPFSILQTMGGATGGGANSIDFASLFQMFSNSSPPPADASTDT